MKSKKPVFFSLARLKLRFRLLTRRHGQTLVEYALILAIISVVAISALLGIGKTVRGVYSTINSQLQRAPDGS